MISLNTELHFSREIIWMGFLHSTAGGFALEAGGSGAERMEFRNGGDAPVQ
jgi:hypothetical protein